MSFIIATSRLLFSVRWMKASNVLTEINAVWHPLKLKGRQSFLHRLFFLLLISAFIGETYFLKTMYAYYHLSWKSLTENENYCINWEVKKICSAFSSLQKL